VDFDAAATASRKQGTSSWRLDPRLDDQQLGNPYYQNNDYDKGHLTRRDDAAWGADDDEAIAANNDTFHYPNAAPQHYLLNQSNEFTGANLDLWGDLENYITEQGSAQRTRLSIFNGSVFGSNDKPLKDALAPLSFYKIVVWRDGDAAPGAIGFVLEQAELVRDLAEEAIEPGRFQIRQRRIAEIEKTLDISFGPVGDWDVLREGGAEESLEDPGILIRRVSDVRLT
jgi:endonuclease G